MVKHRLFVNASGGSQEYEFDDRPTSTRIGEGAAMRVWGKRGGEYLEVVVVLANVVSYSIEADADG